MYENRFYRNFSVTGTAPFQVVQKESDLFIRADRDLTAEALDALSTVRSRIENYIADNPLFERSLIPLRPDPLAPRIVREMINAGILADVGPMAAVAGAIAQHVGRTLAALSDQVIVENGGDLFLKLETDLTIGIHAGNSPLSGRIGFRIRSANTPCGLCTSSGTVGHSYSAGDADAVTIFAADAALADAAATATGNRVKSEKDVLSAVDFAMAIPGVAGVCIIRKDKLGIRGDLELVQMK